MSAPGWYNFKTEQFEYIDTPPAEKAKEFIPQIPVAQGLYDVYIEMGKPMLEAMEKTLKACVGE